MQSVGRGGHASDVTVPLTLRVACLALIMTIGFSLKNYDDWDTYACALEYPLESAKRVLV
jgi:hypothetical protein